MKCDTLPTNRGSYILFNLVGKLGKNRLHLKAYQYGKYWLLILVKIFEKIFHCNTFAIVLSLM